jgi:hypothetical protein
MSYVEDGGLSKMEMKGISLASLTMIVMLASVGLASALTFEDGVYSLNVAESGLDAKQTYAVDNYFIGSINGAGFFAYGDISGNIQDNRFTQEKLEMKNSWKGVFLSVDEFGMVIPNRNCAYLSSDSLGKVFCSQMPSITGWTGTCPGDYKLIIKNGLIIDCKRR